MSMLFAYVAGGEGGGGRDFKIFCQRGSEFFLLALCVCWGGGQVQYLSFHKKNPDPLLLKMTGPYNKKSQGSLRRLSFFKILLV